MIPRDHFINKLRELGYAFKRKAKRVEIYKKKGSTHRVSLPTHKLLAVMTVSSILQQCGCNEDEIKAFVNCSKK